MLKRNLIANFLGQATSALLALIFIPVYVQNLGSESYGLIGLFSALYAVLSILDSSIQALLNRTAAQSRASGKMIELANKIRSFEVILAIFSIILITSTITLSDFLSQRVIVGQSLNPKSVNFSLIIMSLVLSLRLFEGLYRACLMGLEKQVLFNAIAIFAQLFRWAGAAFVVVSVSSTIEAFFLWQALSAGCMVLVLLVTGYRSVTHMSDAQIKLKALLEDRRFIAGMFAISLCAVLLTQTDKLLLVQLVSLAEFGDYTLAATASTALMLIVAPISDTMFPRLSRHWSKNESFEFSRDFHLGAQMVTVLAGTMACVGIAFASQILTLWVSDTQLAMRITPFFQVLLLGNMLNALMWMPYRAQLAAGWTGLAARINLISVICLVPLILLVTPHHGAYGAAWVWVLLNAGYVLIGIHFMFRRILRNERIKWYLNDIALPLGGAAFAVLSTSWLATPFTDSLVFIATITIAIGTGIALSTLAANKMRQLVTGHLLSKGSSKNA